MVLMVRPIPILMHPRTPKHTNADTRTSLFHKHALQVANSPEDASGRTGSTRTPQLNLGAAPNSLASCILPITWQVLAAWQKLLAVGWRLCEASCFERLSVSKAQLHNICLALRKNFCNLSWRWLLPQEPLKGSVLVATDQNSQTCWTSLLRSCCDLLYSSCLWHLKPQPRRRNCWSCRRRRFRSLLLGLRWLRRSIITQTFGPPVRLCGLLALVRDAHGGITVAATVHHEVVGGRCRTISGEMSLFPAPQARVGYHPSLSLEIETPKLIHISMRLGPSSKTACSQCTSGQLANQRNEDKGFCCAICCGPNHLDPLWLVHAAKVSSRRGLCKLRL